MVTVCVCVCVHLWLWPDGFGRLRQGGQQLPGGCTPDGHHLLEADGQQRAVGWEAAALGHQAVIGSDEITRPGGTFICQTGHRERGISEKYRRIWLRPQRFSVLCAVARPKWWRLAPTQWLGSSRGSPSLKSCRVMEIVVHSIAEQAHLVQPPQLVFLRLIHQCGEKLASNRPSHQLLQNYPPGELKQ